MTDKTLAMLEAELRDLEWPGQEEANARHDLATLRNLAETVTHTGARAAIVKDLPAAEKRWEHAHHALAMQSTATPAQIDAAAQAVVDAREAEGN